MCSISLTLYPLSDMPVPFSFNCFIFVYHLSVFLLIWISLSFCHSAAIMLPLHFPLFSSLVSLPSFLSAFIYLPLFTSFLCLKTRKLSPTSRYILRFPFRIFLHGFGLIDPALPCLFLFHQLASVWFLSPSFCEQRYLFKLAAEFTHYLCRLAAHIGLQFLREEIRSERGEAHYFDALHQFY